jgi:DNA-binding NarL/FixJ family response regulator
MVAEPRPDILLFDLAIPGLLPFEIGQWVCTNHPETATLVLTGHDRDCYLAKMVEAGVAGLLTRDETPEGLVEAIRRAARGEILVTREQLARANHWRREVGERLGSLTERERQVLRLLARGQSNQQIAEALTITQRTAETHVGNLLNKLSVASRAEAITWAWQHGAVEEMDSLG